MIHKRILKSDRIRKTNGRFSFIPHRFLLDGFFASLSHHELILYVFLVLASDKNGVSFMARRRYAPTPIFRKTIIRKPVTGSS